LYDILSQGEEKGFHYVAGYTRRIVLKTGLKFAVAAGIGGSLSSGCASLGKNKKTLDEILHPDSYAALTKDWDLLV
jgi:hypothetical protein